VRGARELATLLLRTHPCVDEAVLVVSELVTNALVHGSYGPGAVVGLRIARLPGMVYLAVRDAGRPPDAPRVCTAAGAEGESGRGLAIVRRLAWRMWPRRRHGGGHRIHVLLRAGSAGEPAAPEDSVPGLDTLAAFFPEPDHPDDEPTAARCCPRAVRGGPTGTAGAGAGLAFPEAREPSHHPRGRREGW